MDEVIRRLAAKHGVTLAAAAELLRGDPELAESVAGEEFAVPGIVSEDAFFGSETELQQHIEKTVDR